MSSSRAPFAMLVEQLGADWWQAMLDGDFEAAWKASDRIRSLGAEDPHRFWLGEDFTGKRVMLRCLHGFGDSVQFLRYLPALNKRASSVCVEVAPHFVDLARRIDGVQDVITWGEGAPAVPPAWDVQMEITELPYAFRTQLVDLPGATCYLDAAPAPIPASSSGLQVGLMWRVGQWNPERAIAFEQLRPVLEVANCTFWNLATVPANDAALHEDARCRESVLGLAERIAALDLVITVDTLAAHVAGALGIPAWVMLLEQSDWRWMREREDSPWYPSLRLFRQGADGMWEGVVARVANALRELAERRIR